MNRIEIQTWANEVCDRYNDNVALGLGMGAGKALANSEMVLTSKGWIKNEELKVNDFVVGSDGTYKKILGVFPQGKREIYKISFDDNTSVLCDIEHLWQVSTAKKTSVLSVKELLTRSISKDHFDKRYNTVQKNLNYKIPLVAPVVYSNTNLPLDAYTLGVIIGDGGCTTQVPSLTISNPEIVPKLKLPNGTFLIEYSKRNKCICYGISTGKRGHWTTENPLCKILKDLELFGKKSINKHIPKLYLESSVDNRTKLLQGLLDTDGYKMNEHLYEYSTSSEQLSKDILELVRSLGIYVTISSRIPKFTYNGEKKEGVKNYRIYINFKKKCKYIKSIERSHIEEATCIYIDSLDHLYVTKDFVLTHNTKIAIDRIKQGKYRNVLILGYRTTLKANWLKQLQEWAEYAPGHRTEAIDDCRYWIKTATEDTRIQIHNIQTSYKWDKEYLVNFNKFDFIIADESQELFTPEYGKFFIKARELNIPILALSGTLDYKNKKDFYDKYCPVGMEYYDVEGTITNKVKLYLYEYELSDQYKVEVGSAKKRWKVGELKQYLYLSEKYEEAKNKMFELGASEYFETSMLWMKGKQIVSLNNEAWEYGEIEATKEQKEWGRKFFNSIRYRKELLWNLSSSVAHANNIKYRILSNPNNKVFLFTKSIPQTYRLSPNVIHSKVAKAAKDIEALNKHTLEKFNDGIIRELASVNSLTSGVNIKGLNWIVVDAFDSSEVKGSQIRGRGRRLGIDSEANMIVIAPKNTQASKWFKNSYGDMEYELLTDLKNLNI